MVDMSQNYTKQIKLFVLEKITWYLTACKKIS